MFRISFRGAVVVLVIAFFAIFSGILLINYAEAWFLIVVGWILVPVVLKKMYDSLIERREKKVRKHIRM